MQKCKTEKPSKCRLTIRSWTDTLLISRCSCSTAVSVPPANCFIILLWKGPFSLVFLHLSYLEESLQTFSLLQSDPLFVVQLENLNSKPGSGSSSETNKQQDSVDQLELQFYETQLELYDAKLEILKNEEQLLMAQMDTLRRQIKGTI